MSEHTENNKLEWRCHTPRLFSEILLNPGCRILVQPLRILLSILGEVAQKAIELDDPHLHLLMLRLTLYSSADPESDDYDPDIFKKTEAAINKAKPKTEKEAAK